LKLPEGEVVEVKTVPSDLSSFTVTVLMVLLVTFTVTCWLAVPLNVTVPFCPGVPMVTAVEEPLTVTRPLKSDGTSYSVRVAVPVLVEDGSNRML